MLRAGSKIRLVNEMGIFKNIGEICEVVSVGEDGTIAFKFGEGMHLGVMSADEFPRYFEEVEYKAEPRRTVKVDSDYIEYLASEADIEVFTTFDKCTIVSVRLPNGFVITESSACVDPANYDEEMGFNICINKIIDKLYELEGYRLQCELHSCNNCEEECEDCEKLCCVEEEIEEEEEVDCATCELRDECEMYLNR